jgi:hypothetical protein
VSIIQDSVNTKSFLPHNKNIVTIRDLQKVVESQPDYNTPQQQSQLERLRGTAFWHWDRTEHKEKDRKYKGDCCFNHIIGLPRKDGKRKPLFDYEGMLFRALLKPGYFNSYPSAKSAEKGIHV